MIKRKNLKMLYIEFSTILFHTSTGVLRMYPLKIRGTTVHIETLSAKLSSRKIICNRELSKSYTELNSHV